MSYDAEEYAVKVSHVRKAYKIFNSPGQRFLYHLFKLKIGSEFVALDDINFEIKKGESFGIVGRNGSGKSTMLQILAGIISPTSGVVDINGRIAALLELGSGFNPESTGYENIYMNAAILGVTKDRINEKVDEIIEFADIGNFINQPVKTYSSGMFVRLAFAVAINVDADIILIDEALAVGDIFFRQKCYSKLNELKMQGKTIILVSHGMNEVEQFCDRALLLSKSKQIMCDSSRVVVQNYYQIVQKEECNGGNNDEIEYQDEIKTINKQFNNWSINEKAHFNCNIEKSDIVTNNKAQFECIGIFDKNGDARNVFHEGDEAYFVYVVRANEDIDVPLTGIVFYNQKNTIIFGKDNLQTYTEVPKSIKSGTRYQFLIKVKLNIAIGEYTFDAGINAIPYEYYKNRGKYNREEIDKYIDRICCLSNVGSFAVHERVIGEPMKNQFHGCCDLPSNIEMIC